MAANPNLFPFNASFGQTHQTNLWWLFGLASVLILAGLGLRDPWSADEPRFAQIAMEMVSSGQWFFPSRGGELYPDKPPIFMWSIALFYWLTGSINIAFLLPSAVCGLATVYLVYSLGRQLWSNQVGFYAGLLLLFSLHFTLQAKTAQIDAMVCCWITLGCYGLLRFLLIDGQWRWYYMAWFFMGIGVITKGVGFLPLLMLLPYALLRWFKFTNALKPPLMIAGGWRWWLGPLVMLLAISLWFVPMLMLVEHSQNPLFATYRDNILFKQTVTRYTDSWHHVKPFWYYIISVIPVFWLPISALLPWLVGYWESAIKAVDYRIILPLAWIVLVIIFFSASPGKRGVYVLPALPMLALISAPYLSEILHKNWPQRLLAGLVLFISLAFTLAAVAGWLDLKATVKLAQKYELEPWNFLAVIGFSGLLVFVVSLKSKLMRLLCWPFFISVLWLLYSTWGYSILGTVKTPKAVFANIAENIPENADLALVDFSEQFILFSPYPITHFGYHTDNREQLRAAWQWQRKNDKGYILMNKALITECFDPDKNLNMGFAHGKDWVIMGPQSRLTQCPAPSQSVQEYHYK